MSTVGDFVPELVCLGVDLAICGALYTALRGTSAVLRDLRAAPQIPLDDSMAAAISSHPSSLPSHDSTSTLPYAVIRGEVAPLGKTVTSAYAPGLMQGVIQKVVFTEHKRNMSRTGLWVDSQRVIHSFTNSAPFCLTAPGQNLPLFLDPRVEVHDWTDAVRVDLDTVYDHFEGAESTLGSHLWGWVVGDMQRGVQKTEEMLVKGNTLTGIGQLVAGPLGVSLEPPTDGRPYYLVRNSLASLVKEIEGDRTVIKVFLGLFGGLGLLVSSWAAWKLYRRGLAAREARLNTDRLEGIRADRGNRRARPVGEVPEGLQCVVCLGAEREVILLDCGHVCVCADCAEELLRAGHQCPVCRAVIARMMPAYVS